MAGPAKTRTPSSPVALSTSLDYTAAVRYTNGRRELFCVRRAMSFADARTMVEDELMDVQSIVLAIRSTQIAAR